MRFILLCLFGSFDLFKRKLLFFLIDCSQWVLFSNSFYKQNEEGT